MNSLDTRRAWTMVVLVFMFMIELSLTDKITENNLDETILFWHRGLSLSEIALGSAILDKAGKLSIGQTLRFE